MKVFVTGASGFIGTAVVRELLDHGHEVVGLARSDASAAAVAAAGAEVLRGDLDDLDSLRAGAEAADGVAHLAYSHDFSQMEAAAAGDRAAISAIGDVLAGSDRPFLVTFGTAGQGAGRVSTERDLAPQGGGHPRLPNEPVALALAERGVRVSIVRLPPSVHGEGDHGFVARLVEIAREKGSAAYIGDGDNRWPAVHRLDAARVFRLGLEQAPAGSVLHGVAEGGVPTREIAEVIGRHLGLPVVSVAPEASADHFGWLGMFFGMDVPSSSELTQELLGWKPEQPGLIADLDAGHYFG